METKTEHICVFLRKYFVCNRNQEDVTPIASVLPSATAVEIKVNGQLEISP